MKSFIQKLSLSTESKRVRKTYLLALSLLALFVLGSFFSVEQHLKDRQRDAVVVNLSGRQRMLSQRLVVQANALVNLEETSEKEQLLQNFQNNFKSFQQVHRALKFGDAELFLPEIHSAKIDELYELVDRKYQALVSTIEQFLAESENARRKNYLSELALFADDFLQHMDNLVYEYTAELEASARKYRMHQAVLFLLELGAIFLIALMLFEPLVRRLSQREEEREETLRELLDVQQRYQLAISGTNDGIWEWDFLTDHIVFSDRMFELLGYKPDEIDASMSSWAQLVHPDDYKPTMLAVQKHLKERTPFVTEYRCRYAGAAYRWYRVKGQALWDENGKPLRMAGSLTDISEEKYHSEKLKAANARLQLALLTTNTGLWDWSLVDDKTYFSDSWYTMLGYAPGELPMNLETWKKLCHPEDLEKAMVEIQKYMSGETDIYRSQQRLRKKDGSWMWIEDVGRIVEWDEDAEPLRMIGVHIDIEALKDKEAELKIAREEALKASQAKSDFLANMSHEIRTPMNGVIGMSELLLETALTEDQQELASTVHKSAEILLTIINDILDFSKIEAGKIELSPFAFQLREFFEELEQLHRLRLEQKHITLVWEIDEAIPERVICDPDRLRQVLINLIGNALKFTPDGGAIVVSVEKLSQKGDEQRLKFSIVDTGIGIPEEKQQGIFDAFEQADSSTTREYGGTGLGLAISARLVKLMGGDIELESREGRGSVFSFDIKVQEAPELKISETKVSKERPNSELLKSLKVLLAEDNLVNQKLAARILEKEGCEVVLANNGVEALERFREESFDIILMDIQMPIMGGEEAVRLIREEEKNKHKVPIVALTAHAMREDREKYLGLGLDGYVSKPINRQALFEEIVQALKQSEVQ